MRHALAPAPALITSLGLALALCGCRADGNHRADLGRAGSLTSVSFRSLDQAGERAETTRVDDTASVAGLSRASWAPQTIAVPVDGVHAYRRYTRSYRITDDSSRQRGDYPTPLSALDLVGGEAHDQVLESLCAGPHALYEGLVLVPRLFFVRPDEEVRATPQDYWRAPVTTPRFTRAERAPAHADTGDAAAAPR